MQMPSLPYQVKLFVEAFSKIDTAVLSISNTNKIYRVEHGISLGGKFLNDKGKPETMKVQIIQGDFEDMTM